MPWSDGEEIDDAELSASNCLIQMILVNRPRKSYGMTTLQTKLYDGEPMIWKGNKLLTQMKPLEEIKILANVSLSFGKP